MTTPPRIPPSTASQAIAQDGDKMHAPSALRNIGHIIKAIAPLVPACGKALEIASGTGEHAIRYAAAFPALHWQPTDVVPERLASINAWRAEAGLPNLKASAFLNATTAGWAEKWPGQDLVILSNLLHLISDSEAETLLKEAAQALNSGGIAIFYGPFLRGNAYASEGDRRFDESLHAQDPDIGYKPFQTIQDIQASAGLSPQAPIKMPANNLLLVARKPLGRRPISPTTPV